MCWDTDEIILNLFVTLFSQKIEFWFHHDNLFQMPVSNDVVKESWVWNFLWKVDEETWTFPDLGFVDLKHQKYLESSSDVTCWLGWLPKVNKTNKCIYTYSLYIHNADTTCSIFIFWLGYSFVTSNGYCYVCPCRTLQFIQSSTAGPTYTINTHKVTHINTSFDSHSPPYLITGN